MKQTYLKLGILSLGLMAFTQVNAQSAEEIFSKLDADGDKMLSLEEFKSHEIKASSEEDEIDHDALFARLDANEDGKLDLEEFKSMW